MLWLATSAAANHNRHMIEQAEPNADLSLDTREFPILAMLFPDELQQLASEARSMECVAGVDIILEGQQPKDLYLVQHGLLKVNKRHGDRIIEVGTITPGEAFGEASILYQAPAGAGVRTIEPTVLYAIPGVAITHILGSNERFFRALKQLAERRSAASALAVNPLFSVLPQAVREVILYNSRVISLEPGEQLFHQGDEDRGLMYLVLGGEAEISIPHPTDPERRLVFAKAVSGDEIGEMAILCNDPHAATVTAVTPLRLMTINTESVIAWQRRYPDFKYELYACVQRKLLHSMQALAPIIGEEKARSQTIDRLPPIT